MAQGQATVDYSLIVPTYQPGPELRHAVQSGAAFFRGTNYEIIIVADGKRAEPNKFLRGLQLPIRVITQPHGGVSRARNRGITEARGQYIMFCDDDDYLNGRLPAFQNGVPLVSFSAHCRARREVHSLTEKQALVASLFGFGQGAADYPAVNGGCYSKLFQRQFLLEHRIRFDEGLANSEDVLFNARVIMAASRIQVVPVGIYCYRERNQSVTHRFDSRLLRNHEDFLQQFSRLAQPLPGAVLLTSRVASLYLYQLVFRYFVRVPNYRRQYRQWRLAVQKCQSGSWNGDLNRWVERMTIRLINSGGIVVAVLFARGYLRVKQMMMNNHEQQDVNLV